VIPATQEFERVVSYSLGYTEQAEQGGQLLFLALKASELPERHNPFWGATRGHRIYLWGFHMEELGPPSNP
jgi:hypothetical protein